jgi:hypothetical protein
VGGTEGYQIRPCAGAAPAYDSLQADVLGGGLSVARETAPRGTEAPPALTYSGRSAASLGRLQREVQYVALC